MTHLAGRADSGKIRKLSSNGLVPEQLQSPHPLSFPALLPMEERSILGVKSLDRPGAPGGTAARRAVVCNRAGWVHERRVARRRGLHQFLPALR